MGETKPASWYDHQYRTAAVHRRLGPDSPWYPLRKWCADRVAADDVVLELGCGMGGLMPLIQCRRYYGIDFSAPAVRTARAVAREQAYPATVRHDELPRALDVAGPHLNAFSVLVACEVLEHLEDDVACLDRVPSGTRLLLTLPRRDSESHVRCFPRDVDALLRYGPFLDLDALEPIGEHHIGIEGVRT